MSDGHSPGHDPTTNADIMRRLDSIAEQYQTHDKRITALEADRAIVHRLAEHVASMSREVTVIHALLARSEESVAGALRAASRELVLQVTAAVRAEHVGTREELQELRKAIESRPCLVNGEACAGEAGGVTR